MFLVTGTARRSQVLCYIWSIRAEGEWRFRSRRYTPPGVAGLIMCSSPADPRHHKRSDPEERARTDAI
jgi:hypothetical protein